MSKIKENTQEINTLVEVQSQATRISMNILDTLAAEGIVENIYQTNEEANDVEYTEHGEFLQEMIFDTVFDSLSFQQ